MLSSLGGRLPFAASRSRRSCQPGTATSPKPRAWVARWGKCVSFTFFPYSFNPIVIYSLPATCNDRFPLFLVQPYETAIVLVNHIFRVLRYNLINPICCLRVNYCFCPVPSCQILTASPHLAFYLLSFLVLLCHVFNHVCSQILYISHTVDVCAVWGLFSVLLLVPVDKS